MFILVWWYINIGETILQGDRQTTAKNKTENTNDYLWKKQKWVSFLMIINFNYYPIDYVMWGYLKILLMFKFSTIYKN